MRKTHLTTLVALACLTLGAFAQPTPGYVPPSFTQIDVEVPFAPGAFPSGNQNYLLYELNISNQIPKPAVLSRVEIVDADTGKLLSSLSGSSLRAITRVSGEARLDDKVQDPITVGAGQRAMVFFFVPLPKSQPVPKRLTHRLTVNDQVTTVESITPVDPRPPLEVSAPVSGGPWKCDGAPGPQSYHRRTLLSIDGLARIGQRYAIDFEMVNEKGVTHEGDAGRNSSYYCYGKPMHAVGDGTVVSVVDGLPDNTPPNVPEFSDANRAGGNSVVEDLGDGRFAVYGHMQPGTITVKVGDRLRRGQVLGKIGNSGNSFEPHAHVQVCDRASFLGSQGLPWVFESYTLVDGQTRTPHRSELPLLNQVVVFPDLKP